MKTPTRLLFGVRTSGTVSLTVTASGNLPAHPPDLCIRTSENDIAILCSNKTWVATLNAGDHVVHMPAPDDRWFDGPLSFTLSAPAIIVAPKNRSGGGPLVSWTATTGTSDPKDPLPPPLTASPEAALLAESTWLRSTLTTHGAQVSTDRSAP
jgi:hypothetical protein